MSRTVALPEDLAAALTDLAQTSGRTEDEIVADATRRYLLHERLDRFSERNARRMQEAGISEADVPSIVERWRAEQR